MIDQRLLLKDLEGCIQKLGRKGVPKENVLQAWRLIQDKNSSIQKAEKLRAQKNLMSRQIAEWAKAGRKDSAHQARTQVVALKEELKREEETLLRFERELEEVLLYIPNFPDSKAPQGNSSQNNVEILRENFQPDYFQSRKWLPHWEIMEDLDIFDQKRAGKITGSMFAVLKGPGAKLLRALISFAFDIFEKDYTEFVVPSLVNSASLKGTGQLPRFSNEAYHIEKDDLWAIPTGETPLTALHGNEILKAESLPLKYMTCSPCFRREAGAAGQENRGLQRLHEFHKLELVKICKASQSDKELESLLQDALKPIKLLELPYRVLDLCAGDLTFSSSRVYDIEVYAPGTEAWLEVSSVGLFTDYQSRRCKIRYREDKQIFYAHTLNGSGLATPRVLAAIIENGWQSEGGVKIPQALTKFMGSDYISVPKNI